jgi:hypothetical protein
MCRNIRTLFNFDPPVTPEEVRAASLQFVRKISGFTKPSKANEAAFLAAVDDIAAIASGILRSLETTAPPKNREEEAAKAKARTAERYGGVAQLLAPQRMKQSKAAIRAHVRIVRRRLEHLNAVPRSPRSGQRACSNVER